MFAIISQIESDQFTPGLHFDHECYNIVLIAIPGLESLLEFGIFTGKTLFIDQT